MNCSQCVTLAGDLSTLCGIIPIWAGAAACEIFGLGPEDPASDICAILWLIICGGVFTGSFNACEQAGICP